MERFVEAQTADVMLNAAKHLLYFLDHTRTRSFAEFTQAEMQGFVAALSMTRRTGTERHGSGTFFSNLQRHIGSRKLMQKACWKQRRGQRRFRPEGALLEPQWDPEHLAESPYGRHLCLQRRGRIGLRAPAACAANNETGHPVMFTRYSEIERILHQSKIVVP